MANARRYIGEQYINVAWFRDKHGDELRTKISHVADKTIQKRPKLVCFFDGVERGLVLGPAQIEYLCDHIGADDTEKWRKQDVIVFYDPSVKFDREEVGGIRIRLAGAP